jgi:hypothetical protein
MVMNSKILKKQITKWTKCYGKNNRNDNQYYYDVQVACGMLKIDFDEVIKYMEGKKSKFDPDKMSC